MVMNELEQNRTEYFKSWRKSKWLPVRVPGKRKPRVYRLSILAYLHLSSPILKQRQLHN